jgi:tetratricopeptide (TPR) repeat protein
MTLLYTLKTVFMTLTALLALAACGSMDSYRDNYPDPDERLNHLLALYNDVLTRQSSCFEIRRPASAITDCARLQVEIERLHYDFPRHERTLMTLGVLYYSSDRLDRAQLLLDQLLAQSGAYPEAAVLRSRIALEEGNLALATSVLRRQLTQSPGHPDLLSAMASVYYTGGNFAAARNMLDSPTSGPGLPWVTAYHRGLLAESSQDWAGACFHYQQSLQLKSGYAPAISRIIALAEYIACHMPSAELAVRSPAPPATIPATTTMLTPVSAAVASPLRAVDEKPLTAVSDAPRTTAADNSSPLMPVDTPASSPMRSAAAEIEIATLDAVRVDRMNDDNVVVDFSVSSKIEDVSLMQLDGPDRVIVQMPATRTNLVSSNEYVSDSLVNRVQISEVNGTVNVLVSLSSGVNARMLNEPGRIRLLLTHTTD